MSFGLRRRWPSHSEYSRVTAPVSRSTRSIQPPSKFGGWLLPVSMSIGIVRPLSARSRGSRRRCRRRRPRRARWRRRWARPRGRRPPRPRRRRDPGERAPPDLHEQHAAVGHGDRPLGELQPGGELSHLGHGVRSSCASTRCDARPLPTPAVQNSGGDHVAVDAGELERAEDHTHRHVEVEVARARSRRSGSRGAPRGPRRARRARVRTARWPANCGRNGWVDDDPREQPAPPAHRRPVNASPPQCAAALARVPGVRGRTSSQRGMSSSPRAAPAQNCARRLPLGVGQREVGAHRSSRSPAG